MTSVKPLKLVTTSDECAVPSKIIEIVNRIQAVEQFHPVRIAIDGIDGAGKTTLRFQLADGLRTQGREVIEASVDDFQFPREYRYRRGKDSAEGYYHDSFNYEALIDLLLKPLGPHGNRQFCTAIFDSRTNQPLNQIFQTCTADSLLLVDGVFLHRPDLRPHWDVTIFLDVPFVIALERIKRRDLDTFGGDEEAHEQLYERKYFAAQRHYLATCQPHKIAHIVVDS